MVEKEEQVILTNLSMKHPETYKTKEDNRNTVHEDWSYGWARDVRKDKWTTHTNTQPSLFALLEYRTWKLLS